MLERAGSVAMPLLASVSFALVVLVLTLPTGTVRWPDWALAFLVLAGLLLVGALQAVYWDDEEEGAWASASRIFYDLGTLALVAAITLLLVPPASKSITSGRWFAIVVASGGFVAEVVWIVAALFLGIRGWHWRRSAAARRAAAAGVRR